MSTPQPVENSDEYTLLASMPRPDNAGIVIIGLTTDEYAKITGSELAEECGDNIIVANKGNIVSSTVGNANASTLKDLGLNTDETVGRVPNYNRRQKSKRLYRAGRQPYCTLC